MSNTEKDTQRDELPSQWATLRILCVGRPRLGEARTIVLRNGTLAIGRNGGPPPSLTLVDDSRASELHAELVLQQVLPVDAPVVSIRDLESTNGTHVNGQRISECLLRDGDVVRIGGSFLLLRIENSLIRDAPSSLLLGSAPAIRRVRHELASLATTVDPVLILGESGTGKDVAARAIHRDSRRNGEFVAVNCGAIPRSLLE